MTKREKLLAGIISLLVLVIGSVYAIDWFNSTFETKEDRQLELIGEISKKQSTIQLGRAAERQMQVYLERSLPPDRTLSQSLYQNWLLAQANEAGFDGVQVSPGTPRLHSDLYYQHTFLLGGDADLEQVVRFLHSFYSVDHLHRMRHLTLKPITGSNRLDVDITIEALSLNEAPPNQTLEPRPSERVAHKEAESYLRAIADRNFFSPPNKAPELTSLAAQQGHPNRQVSFRMRATDPEGDELTFSLAGDSLDGARINPRSGEVSWTPTELGDFELDVCVTDEAPGRQPVSRTVTIAVVEPPPETPPPPGFDPATQAVVTGITEMSGTREVWIMIRTEGKVLKLKEGDRLAVGTIQGVVQKIRTREAEIETDDGRQIIVALGRSLLPAESSPISGI